MDDWAAEEWSVPRSHPADSTQLFFWLLDIWPLCNWSCCGWTVATKEFPLMLKALGRGISHTYFKMTVYCQKKEETTATIINYLRPNEACSKLCRCFLHLYTGSCGVSNTAQINRFGPSFFNHLQTTDPTILLFWREGWWGATHGHAPAPMSYPTAWQVGIPMRDNPW
jgi:hypothetical protein